MCVGIFVDFWLGLMMRGIYSNLYLYSVIIMEKK